MAKKLSVKKKDDINRALIDNFITLQKVLTNLAVKFDNLSDNISKLLNLFEISAKSFVEKSSLMPETTQKDREFLDKINTLLEQNKTIAKGLTLMEEKIRERVYGREIAPFPQMQANRQAEEQQMQKFKKLPIA